ncbi:MAG: S-adenosylmethionine:tRNA ribosyltransferase-isomerase [Thermoplasmata archaeon]
MTATSLEFLRPPELSATVPPEERGIDRDEVRLLVSDLSGDRHSRFLDLPSLLDPGDVLVVNESATLPASLPARGPLGDFLLNLSTNYGHGIWVAEPRWSFDRPGPLPILPGTSLSVAGLPARALGPFPGLDRLWFLHVEGDLDERMRNVGVPIRYGYTEHPFPLSTYQTVFARVPGSAEMPSAGRPFSRRLLDRLVARGIQVAPVLLHAGVSSLEFESVRSNFDRIYPEPFEVPPATIAAIEEAHRHCRRVVAVGTTVIRALESAWTSGGFRPMRGFTQLAIAPGRPIRTIDGLLTGLHDPRTSHLLLLYAVAGEARIRQAYEEAIRARYLWHEFGDSHLIWAA